MKPKGIETHDEGIPPYAKENKYLGNERKSGISKERGVVLMRGDVGERKREVEIKIEGTGEQGRLCLLRCRIDLGLMSCSATNVCIWREGKQESNA